MNNEQVAFIQSLTRQDAADKWKQAEQEIATEICYAWKNTKALTELAAARQIVQDFVRDGGKVKLPQLQFYFLQTFSRSINTSSNRVAVE